MKEQKLHAVLDEDMEQLLGQLGQLESIERAEVCCEKCRIPITLKNIQIIIPLTGGKFQYICDRTECVKAHVESQEAS